MKITCKAALQILRTSFILLCKLLLVDVVSSFVSSWLCYFLVVRRQYILPKSNNARSHDDAGIRVIICGFPRCGTMSLMNAMDILGFPCFHGAHLCKPSTATLFIKVQASGNHQDWVRLLHGYKSIADFPAASSYKELLEIYPKAKVILNLRDPQSWYNSFSQTALSNRQSLVVQVVQPCLIRSSNVSLYKKLLHQPQNKELSIHKFKLHEIEVKRHVPPLKLYVLDLEKNEGWAPLCNFLEVPIPNVPFPFVNERASLKKTFQHSRTIHSVVLAFYLCIIFKILMYSWKWVLSM